MGDEEADGEEREGEEWMLGEDEMEMMVKRGGGRRQRH